MSDTWLLVDCNYLCWRDFHTTGGLSFEGVGTGVCFGLLRDLDTYADLFDASRLILAFDSRVSLRKQIYPQYKSTRDAKHQTEDERGARICLYEEIDRLRSHILPACGFKNILSVDGYEADDIIAKVADDLPAGVDATIISADGDLLQCLRDTVTLYSPRTKRLATARRFREKWGISPAQWACVKALEGCRTDDVAGIDGVGPVTAAKWFAGTLKEDSVAYAKISANLDIFNRNMPLVRLPYPGLKLPPLLPDDCTRAKLAKVRADLGIKRESLRVAVPSPLKGFDL